MQAKKQSIQNRNIDTRKKIMLGALFVKAGLDNFYPDDPALLYGMLLDCKNAMMKDESILIKWREMGKELMIK